MSRTPEEREAARLEREARRAAREGRPPPQAVPPVEVPPPDVDPPEPEPPEGTPEPARHHDAGLAREPESLAEPGSVPEPEPEPIDLPGEPEPSVVPEPVEPVPEEDPVERLESEPPPPDREPAPFPPEEPADLEGEPTAEWEHDPLEGAAGSEAPFAEGEDDALEAGGEAHETDVWTDEPEPELGSWADEDDPDPSGERHPQEPVPSPDTDDPRPRTRAAPPVLPHEVAGGGARRSTAPAPLRPPASGPGSPLRKLPGPRAGADSRGGGGGRSRARIAAAVIGVLLVAVVMFAVFAVFQPFKGDGTGRVALTVPTGATVEEIATLLEDRGVVANSFLFRARATLSGRAGDFKAGRFDLRRDMSYGSAAEALTRSPDEQTVTVTIPEGQSRAEVSDVVGESLAGDYAALTRSSPQLDPADYGAENARSLEGFLFPATYELKRGQGARKLVDEQLAAFERTFRQVDMRAARRKNLTRYDVLIIASMIEREAQLPRERRLISSVIYNRLRDGIPLGIDATIRFATGNWTEPLKESELAIDSPYNTRTVQGLPPGPIGSPGIAAIRAAAEPASTRFLYYVVKPNSCGEHAFSRSDADFQRDVDRYNSERAERGGRSPTSC